MNQQLFSELADFRKAIEKFDDNIMWEPFFEDSTVIRQFDSLINLIWESADWPKKRNREKGDILEQLTRLIFSRFQFVSRIERNEHTEDNEIDLVVDFVDPSPDFIVRQKSKLICECKNVKSKSIDVGQVVKLFELCRHNESKLGIFISLMGLGGKQNKWRYAEGKRRKLWLRDQLAIISFTVDEIHKLKEPGINFYTEIKKKYRRLIDDVEDDSPILGKSKMDPELVSHLYCTMDSLKRFDLLTEEEYVRVCERVKQRYE